MDMLIYAIIWLALCVGVAVYAEKKGRSGVGVFFLSLFLSPLVGLIGATLTTTSRKKCPECAEFVQPDAKTCRFCQHKFT